MRNGTRSKSAKQVPLGEFRRGSDENNLAEFPLTLLSDAASPSQKTIEFQDTLKDWETGQTITRRVCITGSDKFGLPTAKDEDVLLALVQLTKIANNFTSAEVPFTKREVIELLGWQTRGWAYDRVEESLHRWKGVSVHYWNAWRDHANGTWTDTEAIGVIDYFRLSHGRRSPAADGRDAASKFVWNSRLFQSFQAGYLKPLDFGMYRSLKRPAARRAYRFLDKRFHHRPDWEFDLGTFACEKLGLSRNYDTGQLKERLQPAMAELEKVGFIEPVTYRKARPKYWTIAIAKKRVGDKATIEPKEKTTDPEAELIKRGVSEAVARELFRGIPAERIQEKLRFFDWLVNRRDKRIAANAPGFLVAAIRKDYPLPKDYVKASNLGTSDKKQKLARLTRSVAAEKVEPEVSSADRGALMKLLAEIDPAEARLLENDAIAAAPPMERECYERQRLVGGLLFEELRQHLLLRHLRRSGKLAA